LRRNGGLDWESVLDLTRELDQWPTYASPREACAALRGRSDEDRCRPMASDWQMPFASSRGYGSRAVEVMFWT
jgi:hypothetical protein